MTFPIPSALASTSCLSFIVPYDFNRFYSFVSLQSNSKCDPRVCYPCTAFGSISRLEDAIRVLYLGMYPCLLAVIIVLRQSLLLALFLLWWLNFVRCFNLTRAKFFPCIIPLESLPMRQTFKYKDAVIFNAKIYAMPYERKRNYLFLQKIFLGLTFTMKPIVTSKQRDNSILEATVLVFPINDNH